MLVAPVFVAATARQQLYVELCGPYLCQQESCVIAAADIGQLSKTIIQHVKLEEARVLVSRWLDLNSLLCGQKLTMLENADKQLVLECQFMSAVRRITLGIPLHPDHMTRKDWQALPGVGEKLSTAIVAERCRGGDFGSVSALLRVRGISYKKLESLRHYFQ